MAIAWEFQEFIYGAFASLLIHQSAGALLVFFLLSL